MVNVDKKTGKTQMTLQMQDPHVVATVMNAVVENLKDYMSDYRTSKARQDAENLSKICEERKAEYYAAQQAYATYVDQHQGVVKMQYQIEQNRLSNEQDLAFNVYNQLAQQLEMARAKVEENTPVCVVMQPAIMPIKASSPKKMMMGLLYVFLAFFGTVAWIVVKDRIIDSRQE